MVSTTGGASRLVSANVTIAQPISFATVGMRTAANTGAFIGSNVNPPGFTGAIAANSWSLNGGSSISQSATDNSYHAGQALLNSPGGAATSSISIDGTAPTTGNAGTTSYSASPIALGRANGTSLPGTIMEAAVAGSDKSADFSAINTNAHARYAF